MYHVKHKESKTAVITASSLRQIFRLLKVITQLLLDSYVTNANKQQLPLPQPSQATYWSNVKRKEKTFTISPCLQRWRSHCVLTTVWQQIPVHTNRQNEEESKKTTKKGKKTQLNKVERAAKVIGLPRVKIKLFSIY